MIVPFAALAASIVVSRVEIRVAASISSRCGRGRRA
jgi:hypothetical protein